MIAKKPATKKPAKETKAAKFIAGSASKNGTDRERDLVPVLINFDRPLLTRIDTMAREMGLNRTAFIVSATAEKLRTLGV